MPNPFRSRSVVLALLLGCTSICRAGGAPAFYPLQPGSAVLSLNDSGHGAGFVQPADVESAALFDGAPYGASTSHELDALTGYSYAGGINASGQLCGSDYVAGFSASSAWRYDGVPGAGGTKLPLGSFGGAYTFADSINDLGQISGASDHPASDPNISTEAFIYTGTPGVDGVMHHLGTLGGSGSEAYSVNNLGQAAGYSYIPDNLTTHAFRYDGAPGAGTMHDLGALPGFPNSAAFNINDQGEIAGYLADESTTIIHAMIYKGTPGADGAMTDLGTLAGGTNSFAINVNDAGYVLGQSDNADGVTHMVLWRPDGTPIDLDAWFHAVHPELADQWVLNLANDINNAGLIAGFGDYTDPLTGNTTQMGFVLDASSLVPEPASLAVISLAVVGSVGRRKVLGRV